MKTHKWLCTGIDNPRLTSDGDIAVIHLGFGNLDESTVKALLRCRGSSTLHIPVTSNGSYIYYGRYSDYKAAFLTLTNETGTVWDEFLFLPMGSEQYNESLYEAPNGDLYFFLRNGVVGSIDEQDIWDIYYPNLYIKSQLRYAKVDYYSKPYPVTLSPTGAYYELTIDEGTLKTTPLSPNGYAPHSKPQTFTWQTAYTNYPITDYTITNTQLQWKNGENGTVTSIGVGAGATSYTMPANTLPASQEIYYRLVVTTSAGTSTSDWVKLQTGDSIPVVTAESPSGIFVDKNSAVDFSWGYDIATGTAQTAYEIQIKTASGDWTTIVSASSAATTATIPAGTLPSGTIQWRVRGKNTDSVASEWSAPLSIIVVGAPDAPALSVRTVSPRPEIAWTSTEQLAYQVQMGENDSGLIWGTAKSFKSPWYLPAGVNLLRVRVMNQYNMWSAWAAANVTITNSSAAATLTLTGTADSDAALSWTAISGAAGYHVYRDGKKIAEVTEASYVDRYSIGSTKYFVRAVYADDSYTDSNTVTLRPSVRWPRITAEDGDWIDLRFSAESLPASSIVTSCDVSLMQYSGAVYPVPEASAHRERTYSINAAFPRGREAAFEALLGRRVWLKDEYDNIIYGIMSTVTKAQNVFYTTFSAVISEVEHEGN